jgi:serine/threonine-protein kinase
MAECPACNRTLADEDHFCPACGASQPVPSRTATLPSPVGDAPREPAVRPASTPSGADARQHLPGSILAGRYRIIERIGRGGMGEVFRAEDLRVGQMVALKFIHQGLERDGIVSELFLSEVRLARQIGHPNVCRVYDIGEAEGVPFLSMEFVDGEDLASLLRRIRRLPADKAGEIAREICAGLAAIHDRDVLHRDLKPANIMIDGRGRVRITDFGLAAVHGNANQASGAAGTPAYMAPEVRAGQEASPRSDLFSLGLVLYETYTGGPASEALLLTRPRGKRGSGSDPSKPARTLEPEVARILARCLETEPSRRPQSALEVAAALPGGDPIAAALAAGRTLEPELLAAAGARRRALRPASGWLLLGALVVGLAVLLTVAPRTRLVPAARMRESPQAMEARARLLLHGLGFAEPGDGAEGFAYESALIDRVAASERTRDRWARMAAGDTPALQHWHRESPRAMVPLSALQQVTPADPAADTPGMVELRFDVRGRLRHLGAVPASGAHATGAPDWPGLFTAADLRMADFNEVEPAHTPAAFADQRRAWEGPIGAPPAERWRVEAASLGAGPVAFDVAPATMPAAVPAGGTRDPVARASALVRAVLFLVAFLVAAWLARRNLMAGRGDRTGAVRVGSALMASRLLVWVLGGHHTMEGLPFQFSVALAWSLYDFAFARVFYLAVEPYVRHFWPRVLVSWVRLVGGRHDDPLVGRDVLVGCLVGVGLCLGVAAHQAAPVLFGLPPGRPDNVGFVEPTLLSTLGLRHQLAQLLLLYRSAVVTALGFVVVLVALRLLIRRGWIALSLATLLFVSVAMPRGELVGLNLALAGLSTTVLLGVLMRVGLLAAMTALIVHSTLQSNVLTWELTTWPGDTSWLALAIVLGLAGVGCWRALSGRAQAPAPAG